MLGDSVRGIDLMYYEQNPSWDIIDSIWNADTAASETSITFTLKLKRKPLYVVLTIVLPVLLLSLLNVFTFVLPCNGGEKAGYAVTIFLAFVVFLTIVESALPANSEAISAFQVYIVLMTMMSTSITIVVTLENRCITWDDSNVPIPGWVKFLADIGRCMPCRRGLCKRKNLTKVRDAGKGEKSNELFSEDSESDLDTGYSWTTVVNGIDIFCIYFFSIFSVLCNLLYLVIASSSAS